MVIVGYSGGSGYIVISYNGGVELAADNVPFFLKKGDIVTLVYAYGDAKVTITKYPLR